MTEKHHLRARARAARQGLSDDERTRGSRALADRVLPLIPKYACSILAYVAMPEEIDPAPLLEVLRSRGARVALPRVTGPMRLALHWVTPSDELVAGPFGLFEPADELPVAQPDEIDVALVPGVAFDAACNRLGYGGCFYDNLLPLLRPEALRIGLAFDVQLVEEVPTEQHDVPLDWVVTPSAEYRGD